MLFSKLTTMMFEYGKITISVQTKDIYEKKVLKINFFVSRNSQVVSLHKKRNLI